MTKPLMSLMLILVLAVVGPGITGCSIKSYSQNLGTEDKEPPPPIALQFSNIPLPDDIELDREKTFIYESGSGTVKVGRLVFSLSAPADAVVEHFRNEMAGMGWQTIRIIEHDMTIMLYEKEDEVVTIIVAPSWRKASVEIQIGPK